MLKIIKNIVCSVFLLFGISSLEAGSISPELQNVISVQKSNNASIDVIIEFKERLSFSPNIKIKRKEIVKRLINRNINSRKQLISLLKLNNIVAKNLWLNNSIAVKLPVRLIPSIASLNKVSEVRLDRKIFLETSSQGSTPNQNNWNITTIGADTVWNNGTTGEGVVIGSMDTGVDINHPDLSSSWLGGDNGWFDPYGTHTTPYDNNGHGTQTTSLIVGGDASGHTIGVAPGAKWIAAKIFDDSDTASISAIHLAFQWMLDPDGDPDTDDGVNIVNNSWNFGTIAGQCDYEFQDDISILRSADIAVVFAAGNSGPSPETSHSPANNEDTIPVGAIDETQNIAFFSSRGPSACDDGDTYPKLTAPGINVLTADLTFGGIFPNSYTHSSGTSYAGPHVSGALALLQSKYPSSSLSDRENALYTTAIFKDPVKDYGSGIIDVNAAMEYLGKAKLLSPAGKLEAMNEPTFTWYAVPDTNEYKLIVIDKVSRIRIVDQTYTAEEAGCTTGTSCSITPNTSLPDGSYRWRIRAKDTAKSGSWSNVMSFTIGFTPTATILNIPANNSSIDTPTPDFNWKAISNSTHYKLIVVDKVSGYRIVDKLYSAQEVGCTMGTFCSITPDTLLPDGSYQWRIRTKNTVGLGLWSNLISFTIGSVPKATSLIAPPNYSNLSIPTAFDWLAIHDSSHYKLIVFDKNTSIRIVEKIYTVNEVGCTTVPICSLILTPSLPIGNYRWRIRTKNQSGWGTWSAANHFILQ